MRVLVSAFVLFCCLVGVVVFVRAARHCHFIHGGADVNEKTTFLNVKERISGYGEQTNLDK